MTIGAVSFQPYVYNVNAISPASMNKLSRISDNVLDKKIDYKGLVKAENENPLRKGQTLSFQDLLDMQMQRGRRTAARVMKPVQEETSAQEQTTQAEQTSAAVKFGQENTADAAWAQSERNAASENAQDIRPAAFDGNSAGSGISDYRMQQAISAYEMFMTA